MTKPAFIYFDKSASPDFSRRPLSSLTRRIYSNRRSYLAWCAKRNAKSQGGYLDTRSASSAISEYFLRARGQPTRRRKKRGRDRVWKTVEEESFRVNPSFSWKPRFVEAGLSGAKLPAWRESTFLPAALLAPLGSSVAWRILCSLWMVFTSAVTRFQREIAGIVCAPFPFDAFSVRVREDFSFLPSFLPSFLFESKSMRFREGCAEVDGQEGERKGDWKGKVFEWPESLLLWLMELSGSINCPFILSTPLNLHLKEVTSFSALISFEERYFEPFILEILNLSTSLFFRVLHHACLGWVSVIVL